MIIIEIKVMSVGGVGIDQGLAGPSIEAQPHGICGIPQLNLYRECDVTRYRPIATLNDKQRLAKTNNSAAFDRLPYRFVEVQL